MQKQKYIGIENELTSFKYNINNKLRKHDFDVDDFQNLLKDKYFKKTDKSIRSSTGNGYYIDGEEIEIITPPVALNKGFATRLTNSLLLGRNYVIENTPSMLHTGYSMHWNLSHDYNNFDLADNRKHLINNLCVPFSLFGLTPLSNGFNIRTNRRNDRYEVLGDSIVKEDQINATALLLGAYCQAIENYPSMLLENDTKGGFPIEIFDSSINKSGYSLKTIYNGRYSKIDAVVNYKRSESITTQAQNILEIFYDWINPFVYKLGERDEINNLEAFIKGEKKLEMDDVKYFDILSNHNGISCGIYYPIEVLASNGLRSQILKVTNKDTLKVPIEGELLGVYALNGIPEKRSILPKNKFITKEMEWTEVSVMPLKKRKHYFKELKHDNKLNISLFGIKDIYTFANKYNNKKYLGSLDLSDVKPSILLYTGSMNKIENNISYDKITDNSV
jgi:hypothetical protein